MPRFHFHTDGGHVERDPRGTELADVARARLEAARLVGDILREQPEELWMTRSWQMTVTDDDDMALFTIEVLAAPAPCLDNPAAGEACGEFGPR